MTDTMAPAVADSADMSMKHVLCAMNGNGDTRVMWDSDNDDEVHAAEDMFNTLKDKGYLAYRTDAQGEKAEVIRRFDPEAERIIMSPQLVGG